MKILQDKCKNKPKEVEETIKKERNLTIEILRILACFLVIVCHTSFWSFDTNIINTSWFAGVAVYLISKTAVPIFFMISGALYLRRDYSYKEMLKKILNRILIPLLLFSILIYCKDNTEISILSIFDFIRRFLAGNIQQHYWYLYTLIGLYAITPFIRKMIENFKNKDYICFFSIWTIFLGIMPILEHYSKISITTSFQIPIVTGYVGYYILGHYMFNFIEFKKNKKLLILNILLFVLIIGISTVLTYFDYARANYEKYTVFLDKLNYISIIIPTINIIYIARYLLDGLKFKEKTKKIITTVGATTFGVYLIHGVFLGRFTTYVFNFIQLYVSKFVAGSITQIIIFITTIIIIYIIKKIPFVKKII